MTDQHRLNRFERLERDHFEESTADATVVCKNSCNGASGAGCPYIEGWKDPRTGKWIIVCTYKRQILSSMNRPQS